MEGINGSFSLGGMDRWLTEAQIDIIIATAPKLFLSRLIYAEDSSKCPESLKQKVLGGCTTLTEDQQIYIEDVIYDFFYAGTIKTNWDINEIEAEGDIDSDEGVVVEELFHTMFVLPYNRGKKKLLDRLTAIANEFI
jgi:hypothetical protein